MKKTINLQVYLSDETMLDHTFEAEGKNEKDLNKALIIESANTLYKRGIRTNTITDIKVLEHD